MKKTKQAHGAVASLRVKYAGSLMCLWHCVAAHRHVAIMLPPSAASFENRSAADRVSLSSRGELMEPTQHCDVDSVDAVISADSRQLVVWVSYQSQVFTEYVAVQSQVCIQQTRCYICWLLDLKMRLFNTCVLPVVTYASESWTMTKDMETKLDACEHQWVRRILQISYRDRMTNNEVGQSMQLTFLSKEYEKGD